MVIRYAPAARRSIWEAGVRPDFRDGVIAIIGADPVPEGARGVDAAGRLFAHIEDQWRQIYGLAVSS